MRHSGQVMAVASGGGHWEQLMAIYGAFNHISIVYVSTGETVPPPNIARRQFARVTDASLWTKSRLVRCAVEVAILVLRVRPAAVVTTGAAPGLFAIAAGRVLGARTLWIDSIANAETLSLSGRIAKIVAHKVVSQWEHVATENRVGYQGAVL